MLSWKTLYMCSILTKQSACRQLLVCVLLFYLQYLGNVTTVNTHPTELQMIKVHINNIKYITIANIYVPPRNSTSTHYKTSHTDIHHYIQYITNIPHSVLTGDVNAHSTICHLYAEDHRGQLLVDVINNSVT